MKVTRKGRFEWEIHCCMRQFQVHQELVMCECDFSFGWVEMYMRSCGKDMGYLEYISAGCDGYRWIHDSTH